MTETNPGKSQKVRDMFMRIGPNFKSYVVSRFDEMEEFKRFTLAAIENEKRLFLTDLVERQNPLPKHKKKNILIGTLKTTLWWMMCSRKLL